VLQHVRCVTLSLQQSALASQHVAFGAAALQQQPPIGVRTAAVVVSHSEPETHPQSLAQPACNGIAMAVSQIRSFDASLPSAIMVSLIGPSFRGQQRALPVQFEL
jgi:hypothetical protein